MMDFKKTSLLPRWVGAGACLAAGILGVSLFAGTVAAGSEAASLSLPGELLPELVLIPAGEMAVGDPDAGPQGRKTRSPAASSSSGPS